MHDKQRTWCSLLLTFRIVDKILSCCCCSGGTCVGSGTICSWCPNSTWLQHNLSFSRQDECSFQLSAMHQFSFGGKIPSYDFYPICTVASINKCHLDFRRRRQARILTDLASVHLLFPCSSNAWSLKAEGALCWQHHAREAEQPYSLTKTDSHSSLYHPTAISHVSRTIRERS